MKPLLFFNSSIGFSRFQGKSTEAPSKRIETLTKIENVFQLLVHLPKAHIFLSGYI